MESDYISLIDMMHMCVYWETYSILQSICGIFNNNLMAWKGLYYV
jgi:hypothetical protein